MVSHIIVHLDLLLNLFQQPLPSILAEIKVIAKLLYNLAGIIIFKHFYFLNIFPIKFDLQNTNWLLNHWQI